MEFGTRGIGGEIKLFPPPPSVPWRIGEMGRLVVAAEAICRTVQTVG